MRILMRNTVFKTGALAGLFSCLLAFAGAFSGITPSVHAMHGFIHAEEVGTDTANLQEFVEAAVDEYYINTIIRQHCDFSTASFAASITIDLATADVSVIKSFIPSFPLVGLTGRSDIEPYCNFDHRFEEVFGRGDGDWKSDSVYLFIMDENGKMLYNGANKDAEDDVIEAIDRGDRDVAQLIIDQAAKTPANPEANDLVQYCWDDPTTTDDDESNPNAMTAPGSSWKISYVVSPFAYLGAPGLAGSPSVIFGSGIYPKTGTALDGCEIVGGEGMEPGGMEPGGMEREPITSVSGGGCAIVAGSDNASRGTTFNLLLIVSALFFTISFRRRAMDK